MSDDEAWDAYEERREDERRQEREREEAYREELEQEDARRLARYDEALSLIEEFLRDGLEPQLARRAEAFLAAEGKVAG